MTKSIFNPVLVDIARSLAVKAAALSPDKEAFVDTASASMMDPSVAAAGGAPMAAMGGADPMAGAMPGMEAMPPMPVDPAAAGMPVDPAAAGVDPLAAEAPLTRADVEAMIAESGGGAAGGAAAGGAKKKIDVDIELFQIKTLLVKMYDFLNIPIPSDVVMGPDGAAPGGEETPAAEPAEAGGETAAAGLAPSSAISAPEAIQGASPELAQGAKTAATKKGEMPKGFGGVPFDPPSDIETMGNQAAALAKLFETGCFQNAN